VAEGISQLKWTYFQQRPQRLYDMQIFDDASRGPLGSMTMLWNMNIRALVASTGAILTILSLAADPFAQQILSYPSRMGKASNITATIGAATSFDRYNIDIDTADPYGFLESATGTVRAMSAAIFGSPVQSSYRCSSDTYY
jgi:hypothetical protein